MVTSRWRRLPDFLVIGAQKSGTTSLYAYLTSHPQVRRARTKEVHYFDRHYERGLNWYRSHFPLGGGGGELTGEATPAYLFYPPAPARAKATVPTARLIAVLRNPVERAYSHWNHERAKGFENLSLAEAISQEDARLAGEWERSSRDPTYYSDSLVHFAYRARGCYADQLERWLEHYPRSQLLVLPAERLFADPAATTAEALGFLGLSPAGGGGGFGSLNARDYSPIDDDVRRQLVDFFRPRNERLFELLGEEFDWD